MSESRLGTDMKAAIHPSYNEIRVNCACGNAFVTRSTHKGDIGVESAPPAILSLPANRSSWTPPAASNASAASTRKATREKPKQPPSRSKFRGETDIPEKPPLAGG